MISENPISPLAHKHYQWLILVYQILEDKKFPTIQLPSYTTVFMYSSKLVGRAGLTICCLRNIFIGIAPALEALVNWPGKLEESMLVLISWCIVDDSAPCTSVYRVSTLLSVCWANFLSNRFPWEQSAVSFLLVTCRKGCCTLLMDAEAPIHCLFTFSVYYIGKCIYICLLHR